MLPSSLLGLSLFIVLLTPGLAFVLRHEHTIPAQQRSAFRETLRVAFVSVACITVTGLLYTGLRWLFPAETLDIGGLIHNPSKFLTDHHVGVAWWSLTIMGFAIALGVIAGDPRIIEHIKKVRCHKRLSWLTGYKETAIRPISSWQLVFHIYDNDNPGPIRVGAQLDDGTYLQGWHYSKTATADDGEDRDIVLSGPLTLITADGTSHDLSNQFSVISARRIVRLDVTHLSRSDEL